MRGAKSRARIMIVSNRAEQSDAKPDARLRLPSRDSLPFDLCQIACLLRLSIVGIEWIAARHEARPWAARTIREGATDQLALHLATGEGVGRHPRVHQHHAADSHEVGVAGPNLVLGHVREPLHQVGVPRSDQGHFRVSLLEAADSA